MFEDEIQVKNSNVTGVNAPSLVDYPEGRIDTDYLPLSLTWMEDVVPEAPGGISLATYNVNVYVNPVGQDTFITNKVSSRTLLLQFLLEYTDSTGYEFWLSTDPPVRIIPTSISFSGYMNTVKAPDGQDFHGFSFSFDVSYHTDHIAC